MIKGRQHVAIYFPNVEFSMIDGNQHFVIFQVLSSILSFYWVSLPFSLVMAYTFAIATSGKASLIYMVGVDGYADGDPRNKESEKIISEYKKSKKSVELIRLTPTKYSLRQQSIFFKYR